MANFIEVMNMLDWNQSSQIQFEGRNLAKNFSTIAPFIQPLTPEHNKNVWENCARIISDRSDEELKKYLVELLEWLQDLNWPGALCILNRLQRYSDADLIYKAIYTCIEKAKEYNDETWAYNLYMLLQMRY